MTILDAVNDDMPFLLDSTLAELVARGLEPRLVAHPIVEVERGPDGGLKRLGAETTSAAASAGARESVTTSISTTSTARRHEPGLVEALGQAYADVAAVTRDVGAMRDQLAGLAAEYRTNPPPLPDAERMEAVAF